MENLNNTFYNLVQNLTANANQNAYIGTYIRCERLDDEIPVRLMKKSTLSTSHFDAALDRVAQSNDEFLLNEKLL